MNLITKKLVDLSITGLLTTALIAMSLVCFRPNDVLAAPDIITPKAGYPGTALFESSRDGNIEIYSMDINDGSQTRLTNSIRNDSMPLWSPDGTKILFESNRLASTNYEVFVMDADGSNQMNLTNTVGNDRYPRWSPDGTKIAYSNSSGIRVMNSDGSSGATLVAGGSRPLWSPDGSKLLYTSGTGIYSMDADGSNQTLLVNVSATPQRISWSPDGTKILYMRYSQSQIWVMDADGQNQTMLSNFAWSDHAGWSPDGTHIVFMSPHSWTNDIYVQNVDTLEIAQLTDGQTDNNESRFPQFLPDGRIIYDSFTADWEEEDLFIMNIDGTGKIRLNTAGQDNFLAGGSFLSTPNTAPITSSDTASVAFNSTTLMDVISNDTDEEALSGDNLSIAVQPSNGTASIVDGKVRYIPDAGFQGADSLTYQICDSFLLNQLCSTGVVNLTVLAPTAPNITVSKVNGETYSSETNSYVTASLRPTFSGTATPGSEIQIEIHSDPIVLTATADEDGNWSVTPNFDLPTGEHMVYISATLYGLTTELDEFGLTIQPSLANTGENLRWIVGGSVFMVAVSVSLLRVKRKSLQEVSA